MALIGFFGFAGFCFFGIPVVCCAGREEPGVAITEQAISTIVNRACWIIFGSIASVRLSTLKDQALENENQFAKFESEFNFECTDQYSRVDLDQLRQDLKVANEPIMTASKWVNSIWAWIAVEVGIIILLVTCACANVFVDRNHHLSDNCRSMPQEAKDFAKTYLTLN